LLLQYIKIGTLCLYVITCSETFREVIIRHKVISGFSNSFNFRGEVSEETRGATEQAAAGVAGTSGKEPLAVRSPRKCLVLFSSKSLFQPHYCHLIQWVFKFRGGGGYKFLQVGWENVLRVCKILWGWCAPLKNPSMHIKSRQSFWWTTFSQCVIFKPVQAVPRHRMSCINRANYWLFTCIIERGENLSVSNPHSSQCAILFSIYILTASA
jgi:hypothetical protein